MNNEKQTKEPWHRGYGSKKQQVKFEGRKPTKLTKDQRRKAA